MAELDQYKFSHKDLVEALIKQQGLHSGVWKLTVEFGIGAANIGKNPTDTEIFPAAIVPIVKFGLTRVDVEDSLAVDASRVNPASPSKSGKRD